MLPQTCSRQLSRGQRARFASEQTVLEPSFESACSNPLVAMQRHLPQMLSALPAKKTLWNVSMLQALVHHRSTYSINYSVSTNDSS